jgi:hypothetical protein
MPSSSYGGGQNKILSNIQHQDVLRYATKQAEGFGATKKMLYSAICHLRKEAKQSVPTYRWFQT